MLVRQGTLKNLVGENISENLKYSLEVYYRPGIELVTSYINCPESVYVCAGAHVLFSLLHISVLIAVR